MIVIRILNGVACVYWATVLVFFCFYGYEPHPITVGGALFLSALLGLRGATE